MKTFFLNAAFLPEWVPGAAVGNNIHRASGIAEHISSCEFDIVVLCEVFAPEARQTLRTQLSAKGYTVPGGVGEYLTVVDETSPEMVATVELKLMALALKKPLHVRKKLAATASAKARRINRAAFVGADGGRPTLQPGTEVEPAKLGEIRQATVSALLGIELLNSGLFLAVRCQTVKLGQVSFHQWNSTSGIEQYASKGFFVAEVGSWALGKYIDVVGAHLRAFEGSGEAETRRHQLSQVKSTLSSQIRPRLVVGDFNIIGETRDYEILSSVLGHGFADQYRLLHPNDHGYTWSAKNPNTKRSDDSGKNERLDYVFLQQSGVAAEVEINVEEVLIDEVPLPHYSDIYASDHFGLVTSFEPRRRSHLTGA